MHTDMPVHYLGEALVERNRKIWWTIYILDRLMTSLMGLPQSIHDSQIHHQLPTFHGSPQKVIALGMQIRMCQIIAEINSSEYFWWKNCLVLIGSFCSCLRTGWTTESKIPDQNKSCAG